ncbi:MAG TPA: gluconate 2-dehydrogenase subunit 3 family protein [Blastocatellia bacterium]|nr:gluconate 2-dehydrogenase subunit 3 family protein [Blastocatellia bacterium]
MAKKKETGLTRREMMKATAGAAVAAPLVGLQKNSAAQSGASKARAPRFFTRQEFALVDELTELIIPTDAHSPGARAARVAAYIDFRLAESWEEEPKELWRNGLKLIDALSQEMHGRPFMKARPAQRVAVLTRISQNEKNPQKPEEIFFRELKARTVRAYYSSKIGIHNEMEYKGNTYLKEFVGYDAT